MSAEQVARDFLNTFEKGGVEPAISYLADDMTLKVTNPPIAGGKDEFIGQGTLIKEAMPDFKWGIQKVTTQGDQATVTMRWTATHTGTLRLSAFMPGKPDIPATGIRVSVPDRFIFTVRGNQISGLHIDSGPDGGLPEMLKQLGVQVGR